jgi:hypothetical protein
MSVLALKVRFYNRRSSRPALVLSCSSIKILESSHFPSCNTRGHGTFLYIFSSTGGVQRWLSLLHSSLIPTIPTHTQLHLHRRVLSVLSCAVHEAGSFFLSFGGYTFSTSQLGIAGCLDIRWDPAS